MRFIVFTLKKIFVLSGLIVSLNETLNSRHYTDLIDSAWFCGFWMLDGICNRCPKRADGVANPVQLKSMSDIK
ncbi:MAG: hypothetical protein DRR19_11285 [Candidatus Parabeggiatoa sp. nov. 1]|nr:MAG: hypothetical protein DRR19_11285 [Gammaproteobacteria bacterium]